MAILIRVMVLLLLSQGAQARIQEETAEKCAQLLSQQPSPLDYAVSDLEGLFLTLVQKVQSVHQVPASRREIFIKDILNMKAEALNRVMSILPMVKKAETLDSIYLIIDSLGVPPAMYGLTLDPQTHEVVSSMAKSGRRAKAETEAEVVNRPIGFVTFAKSAGRDLPEELHRSIGFGPQRIDLHAPPKRLTGKFSRSVSPENKELLIVTDPETNSVYQVSIKILTSSGADLQDKTYRLEFNREMLEWIVRIENLNNPTGHIGFLN